MSDRKITGDVEIEQAVAVEVDNTALFEFIQVRSPDAPVTSSN